MRKSLVFLVMCWGIMACQQVQVKEEQAHISKILKPSLVILGTAQDGGSPHIGCEKNCCKALFLNPDPQRKVVALGLVDPQQQKQYLFEATPDLPAQISILNHYTGTAQNRMPDGIFLTHAHIGHYSGLIYLGKEAKNANQTPVYAMPRMQRFLTQNGPWSQLVSNENIAIQPLIEHEPIQLSEKLKVIPFLVPHRDEYSETVGYTIIGPNKTALFIPDIDKWEKWEVDISDVIAKVDYAFLDATFYDAAEINNRDISQIPHPFVIESMEKFSTLSAAEKQKIYFIHFNHTNPLLNKESEQAKTVLKNGFKIASIHQVIEL